MVTVTVAGGMASFEIEGIDKLWSLKSRLDIPVGHIRGVRPDTQVAHGWWHGIRMPGTNIPGVLTAGTFYEHGKKVFWDVHNPDQTVVIELSDERYDELIVEVGDPAETVRLLRAAIGGKGGTAPL